MPHKSPSSFSTLEFVSRLAEGLGKVSASIAGTEYNCRRTWRLDCHNHKAGRIHAQLSEGSQQQASAASLSTVDTEAWEGTQLGL